MGLEHLLDALERDANAQIDQLLVQARAEADGVTAAATAALAQRRGAAAEARERTRLLEVEQAVTRARRAARRSVLEARERLLERVFTAARNALPAAAAGAEYRAGLPTALAGGLAALGDVAAVIRCPESLVRDLERLRPPATPPVRVVVDPAAGSGFRVASADGAVEVDDTLETRLDRLRPDLARRVLAQLGLES
jgi:vacuolar-type H+-ATPase subunit E/Vma4